MAQNPDEDRIRRKAHELWEAEGHPHGRDRNHWDQAKEIIAIEDSQATTLLPRNTGAQEPIEPRQAVENYGDLPGLTDQGEHALTDISREPESTLPSHFTNATGKTTGAVARPAQAATPGKPAAAVTTKSASVTGKPAPKVASKPDSAPRKGRTPPAKGR